MTAMKFKNQNFLETYFIKCDQIRKLSFPNMPGIDRDLFMQTFSGNVNANSNLDTIIILPLGHDDWGDVDVRRLQKSCMDNKYNVIVADLINFSFPMLEYFSYGAKFVLYDERLAYDARTQFQLGLLTRMLKLANVPVYSIQHMGVNDTDEKFAPSVIAWQTKETILASNLYTFISNFRQIGTVTIPFVWNGKEVAFLPAIKMWFERDDVIEHHRLKIQGAVTSLKKSPPPSSYYAEMDVTDNFVHAIRSDSVTIKKFTRPR